MRRITQSHIQTFTGMLPAQQCLKFMTLSKLV